MSIISWNTQTHWESYTNSDKIDTKENPGYLRRLLLNDSFNNNDLSADRWTITNSNIIYNETNNLTITSDGANPSFKILQKYQQSDIFQIKFQYSDLSSNTSLNIFLEYLTKLTRISITDSSLVIVVDGVTTYSSALSITSGYLTIEYYSDNTQVINISDGDSFYHLDLTTIDYGSEQPYLSLELTSTNTTDILCVFNNLSINGLSPDVGHMIGYARYKFKTTGNVKGIYHDATTDPEETHLMQISPDGSTWYGPTGEDSSFKGTYYPVTTVPMSSNGEYYWHIWMVPSMFLDSLTNITLSTYLKLQDKLLLNTTFSKYIEYYKQLNVNITYANYLPSADALLVNITNSNYSEETIAITIANTDHFWSINNLVLGDTDDITTYYLDTSDYDGVAVYGSFTGKILIENDTGTYMLPNQSSVIINTTGSKYVKIIAVGDVNINHIGVFGIWL